MNFLQRLFSKKQVKKEKQIRSSFTGYSGSHYSKRDEVTNDLSNPLNPLSPFWIGQNMNDASNDNYTPNLQQTENSNDFGGFGGGSTGGGGASGSWDDNSSSSHSSSSYDSGSSSSYDSGSSSSSSDSGSSSSCD